MTLLSSSFNNSELLSKSIFSTRNEARPSKAAAQVAGSSCQHQNTTVYTTKQKGVLRAHVPAQQIA